MLSVLWNWGIIFCAVVISGYTGITLLCREKSKALCTLDIYIVSGLVMLNTLVEIISIFMKISGKACVLVGLLGIILMVGCQLSKSGNILEVFKDLRKVSVTQWFVIVITIYITMLWTVGPPEHYDTSLYHAQAIRWIEEYGVVPGLGNLHNRFAYNSAFMVLQALFSMKWLAGQSLHTLNGFLCCMALIYSLLSNKLLIGKKPATSDFFKIVTIIYIILSREDISSPASDTLAMLLVLYVFTKWSEFVEQKENDNRFFIFLGVVSLYAITVKLSTAGCVFALLYAAILLLMKRNIKGLLQTAIISLIIVIPWLTRNVIISGYIVYPYPQLDFFNVDWKMPKPMLTYDSREIMVWGRGYKDVIQFEVPFSEWFIHWFNNAYFKEIIFLGLFSTVLLIIYLIWRWALKRKIKWETDIMLLCSIINLAVWLFSAPLMRYGMVYLLIPQCELLGLLVQKLKQKNLIRCLECAAISILLMMGSTYLCKWTEVDEAPKVMQKDYEWKPTEKRAIVDDIFIWYPVEGDQCSYDVFPCIPYKLMIERLELRGTTLKDGFRVKEEYQELHLRGSGDEW